MMTLAEVLTLARSYVAGEVPPQPYGSEDSRVIPVPTDADWRELSLYRALALAANEGKRPLGVSESLELLDQAVGYQPDPWLTEMLGHPPYPGRGVAAWSVGKSKNEMLGLLSKAIARAALLVAA